MAEQTIDFNGAGDRIVVADYTTYRRISWTADDEWTAEKNLHALECTWCLAPSLPVATLRWDFGQLRQLFEPSNAGQAKLWRRGEYYAVERLTAARQNLVKIVHGDGRTWVGVLEFETEEQGGAAVVDKRLFDSGVQHWHAYGLERLLQVDTINSGVVENTAGDDTTTTRHGLTFNDNGEPNRSEFTYGDGAYVFAGGATAVADRAHWSTLQIVKHLLEHHQPRDAAGDPILGAAPGLVLSGAATGVLPDWDRPTISTAGKTLHQLLAELIDRRRLLAWFIRYTAGASVTAADDSAEVHVVTLTDEDIDPGTGSGSTLTANPRIRHLEFETDPMSTASYQTSELAAYDQVVVRGDRRRCVATLQFDKDGDPSSPSLAAAWTSADEADYFSGPESADDWGDAEDVAERQRIAARHRAGLPHVLAAFKLPDNWDGTTRDDRTDVMRNVFPDLPLYPLPDQVVELERTLPLIAGVDYSGSAIADDSYTLGDNLAEAPPLVLFKRVDSEQDPPADSRPFRYLAASAIGLAAGVEPAGVDDDNQLSAHVRVDGRTLTVRLQNAPQHAIDGKNTNASLLDEDELQPEYDVDYLLATVSMRGDRIEARWPTDDRLTTRAGRPVRRKYLDAPGLGETFVPAGTVVGLDSGGFLKWTDRAGFIPPRDSATDTHVELVAIAKLAARWYTTPRLVVTIRTRRFFDEDDLQLGDYIKRTGKDDSPAKRTIDGPLSQITYRTPLGTPGEQQPPEAEFVTWFGEIEAARLVPGRPGRMDPARGLGAFPAEPSATAGPGDRFFQ